MGEPGETPVPTPLWNMLPRSAGPYGILVFPAAVVEAMLTREVEMPDQWFLGAHWGLGWGLFEWDGVRGFGHDGSTFGQLAYLRALPGKGLAIALLTNGGGAAPKVFEALCRELCAELASVAMPGFAPASEPLAVDTRRSRAATSARAFS
ncbi:serine hydrolase [Streptomyces sp. NPDC055144]